MQTTNAAILRETHSKRMDGILKLLEDVSLWFRNGEESDAQLKANAFAELNETLRTGEYTIVMVGEFSTGKSTLLNALMGEKLLPSFKTETTATVNFLRHTERAEQGESGCVFYKDGTKKILENTDYDVVQQHVSTRGQDVAGSVAHLDLFLDSEFLCDNVTLVDSPGLNGVAEGHKDITQEQILKSHACIFVFSSDHPGSKSDFEFLSDLKSNVSTILFVLNKIDEIKEDEGETPESVICTIQENYRKYFPNSECPEIWPLASLPALVARSNSQIIYRSKKDFNNEEKINLLNVSKIQRFESRLMEFLTKGEKTKRQALEPVTRTLEIGNRNKVAIENEIRLLGQADDAGEIEKSLIAVQDAMKNCETELQVCYVDVSKKVRTGLRDVIEALDADINRYTECSISALNSFDNLDDINEYLRSIGENYNVHAISVLEKYDTTLRDSVIEQVFSNYHMFAERIQEGIDGIDGELSVNIALNTKEYVFNAGLANMEQQEEDIRQQLELFRSQEEQSKNDSLAAQANMRKQRKIEEQLRAIEEQRAEINGRIMPAIIQTTKKEERTKTFREKGVAGVIVDFFGGEKTKVVEVVVVEDSAFKAEAKKRDAELQSVKEEKAKLALILDSSVERNLLTADEAHARRRAELDRAEDKYLELIRENKEKFQSKYNAQIQKVRNELRNLLGDKTAELISKLKKVLRNQEKKYTGIVSTVIMANLKQSLADEQKKQENLRARLNSSEKERDERIAKLSSRLEELDVILLDAKALQTELEGLTIENVD